MMKRPIEEVYGCDAAEGFNKGKKETVVHYRALLRLSNEYRLSENDWNLASSKANSIAVQIELLEDIIKADGETQRRALGSGRNACCCEGQSP